ncbi:MAG: META domain-containing protein [Mycobacterium sp.]
MRMVVVLAVAGTAVALTASGCGSAKASDPLTGTSWQLIGIDSMAPDEQPNTTIADPSKYTVTFGDDGRAAFQVDCNRGSSAWQFSAAAADSGSLTFGPIALTRMFCPQPSSDTVVAAALGRVRSYLIQDGKLHLSLEADSGIMHWQPSTAAN